MGLFKSIKKAVKGVFKGIKKVFKKVGSFVGKVFNSGIGKALMIAAAVFTGGAALMAGIGNAAATTGGFLTKFVAGAKGFMSGLLQPMSTWKGAVGGAQGGGGVGGLLQGAAEGSGALAQNAATAMSQAPNPGAMVESGTAAAPDAATAGLKGPPAPPGSEVVAGATRVPQAAPPPEPGLLSKVGSGVMDFAKTTGGGLMLTNAISGLAQGKALEDQLKHGDFYDRKWADPRQQLILEEASGAARGGFLDRARRYESTRVGAVAPAQSSIRGYQRGERTSGYATGTS